MSQVFELFADIVMLIHAGFSLFLIVGLVLIIAGTILRWSWIRDARFRAVHLATALFIAARAWMGIPCPFSAAEDALRPHAVENCFLGGGFHHSLHRLAFRGNDPAQFRTSATIFAALITALYLLQRATDSRMRPSLADIREVP